MREKEQNDLLYILIGIACLLGAVVVAYPFLFVQEPSPIVILTDGGSGIGQTDTMGLVNINQASEEELQELQGIGPVLAKRIVEYRQANGSFERLEDLKNVTGIGDKTFEKFRHQITLSRTDTEK